MAFTYTGDPAGSSRDKVRFLLQDTSSAHYHLSDEEIAWLLTEWADVYDAATAGAEAIAASYAHKADYTKTVGDLSLTENYSNQSSRFTELATRLRLNRNRRFTVSWVANPQALQSTADRTVETYNTDSHLGQFDNPRGTSEGTSFQ